MRSSGILMHITSLPGPYGIGTMGAQARAFVDFLAEAGQSCWQILPLTPTGYGDSPYQSISAFAGNPYLIDLEILSAEGLLLKEELADVCWCSREDRVDFGLLYRNRMKVLRMAFARYQDREEAFARFRARNDGWLPDFAIFMALKEKYGGKPWYEWDEDLKFRRPDALSAAFTQMQEDVQFFCFLQFQFFRQWHALHDYARSKGITIIGDVPIYVPLDSVEVWKNPELFQLDEKLDPVVVAGCPPDGFTAEGQLWGNPIYNWQAMEKDGYRWWIERLRAAGKLCDGVRIDHFRGLESYWAIPFGDDTARNGYWVKGPGSGFVKTLKAQIPGLSLIAEDLGYLTQEVLQLRAESGWPGMKLLQFAFDSREPSDYLPHTYSANTVCYTGTHDNMTMQQWFDSVSPETRAYAAEYMTLSEKEGYVWGAIRTAMASVSDTCIIPMQDYLALGADGRMNLPGTLSTDNWTWRMKEGALAEPLAARIRALTGLYARLPENK